MSKGCCCCWSNPCSVESKIASQSGSFSDHELINNTSMGSFGQRDLFTFGFFSLSYTLSLSFSLTLTWTHSLGLSRSLALSLSLTHFLVETSKKRKLTNMRGKTFFSIISTLPPHTTFCLPLFFSSVCHNIQTSVWWVLALVWQVELERARFSWPRAELKVSLSSPSLVHASQNYHQAFYPSPSFYFKGLSIRG